MKQLTALAILLLTISNAYATVVYSQDPTASYALTSAFINLASDPGFNGNSDADQQVWTTFQVTANTSVNEITWYGTQSDGSFAVDLHATTTNCSSCGLAWVNGSGTYTATTSNTQLMPTAGPYTNAQVHETLINGNLYSYYIDLPTAITLSSGNLYVISFVNNYSSYPFSWETSNTGNGISLDYNVGRASILPLSGNFAFSLSNTAAVPLPTTAWLFLSSIIGLLALKRKTVI